VNVIEDRFFGTQPPSTAQGGDLESAPKSALMRGVQTLARQAAAGDTAILLQGETGTGKGSLARAIHAWSRRSQGPFVALSCSSFSALQLEAELFGYVLGAFEGATRDFAGRIAQAEGGTLFLDELGELPQDLQAKLLGFLRERHYCRLGESSPRHADIRLICATHLDLRQAVREQQFKEELFYRLNAIEIELPPLRKRSEDIVDLAEGMLRHFARENHHHLEGFDGAACQALRQHDWPGNLRELRNAVERAAILCGGGKVGLDYFPENFSHLDHAVQVGDKVSVEQIEETHIRRVITQSKSMEEAAQILGMHVVTLWRWRKKHVV
jgi:NtrC-family two-component system response regulator AlgB